MLKPAVNEAAASKTDEIGSLLQHVQKGFAARPQRARDRGVPERYVEGPSDARTKLKAFFNVLKVSR